MNTDRDKAERDDLRTALDALRAAQRPPEKSAHAENVTVEADRSVAG